MHAIDTIVAIATAPGRGGVGVLRLSGPDAARIAGLVAGELPPPRAAGLRSFRSVDGVEVDRGLVLHFPAPRSFTGEDVVELQAHGGPVLLQLLVEACCHHGARRARAGEFSERAFLNGRIDLAQAEAVADLIDAASAAAVRAANQSLQGAFSAEVDTLVEALIALRADLEAALDFADEDLPWLNAETLRQRLDALREQLDRVLASAARGRRLREGLVVAIAGRPNVGKSTLLNRLAGEEVAIVSPIAGTTRDLLRETLLIDGLPLRVIDTAGLRDSDDPIERIGVERARAAIAQAELLLVVIEEQEGLTPETLSLLAELPELPRWLIRNKCDLEGRTPERIETPQGVELRLSAATGAGIELLRSELRMSAGLTDPDAAIFSARARHLDALNAAAMPLARASRLAVHGGAAELIADELRQAQSALEDITGRYSSEDLLGRIFSQFCIGK